MRRIPAGQHHAADDPGRRRIPDRRGFIDQIRQTRGEQEFYCISWSTGSGDFTRKSASADYWP
jgi:hypothetical protein